MAELVLPQQPFMPSQILHGQFVAMFTFLVQNNFPLKRGTKVKINIKYRAVPNDSDLQIARAFPKTPGPAISPELTCYFQTCLVCGKQKHHRLVLRCKTRFLTGGVRYSLSQGHAIQRGASQLSSHIKNMIYFRNRETETRSFRDPDYCWFPMQLEVLRTSLQDQPQGSI